MSLTLSSEKCRACGKPLVEEWLIYWAGPTTPRHANCGEFARQLAESPERFGLDASS